MSYRYCDYCGNATAYTGTSTNRRRACTVCGDLCCSACLTVHGGPREGDRILLRYLCPTCQEAEKSLTK